MSASPQQDCAHGGTSLFGKPKNFKSRQISPDALVNMWPPDYIGRKKKTKMKKLSIAIAVLAAAVASAGSIDSPQVP